MDVVLIAFYYYCNIELTVLLCTGIWQPKSRNHMLRKNNHEPHELWLAPPDRRQPSTRSRSAPDTQSCVTKLRKGDQVTATTMEDKRGSQKSPQQPSCKRKLNRVQSQGRFCLLTYTALIQIGRKNIPTTDGWTKLPTVVEPEPHSWNQEQTSMKANSPRTG